MANEKLQTIIVKQKEAQEKRDESKDLQALITRQKAEIESRRHFVLEELSKAEPAVKEAQSSVSSIKRQHLTELRSMGNPPDVIKIALESVCLLLGIKCDGWKTVQGVMRRDDFIALIVNYETSKLTKDIRNEANQKYLADPNFNFNTANHASKACGPLVEWVIAQVNYATILEKIEPLKIEVAQLEISSENSNHEADIVTATISDLDDTIMLFKNEYAELVREVEIIKLEMNQVERRVGRCSKLCEQLAGERTRWENTSGSFQKTMGAIAGNSLISSAYLTYMGNFNVASRDFVLSKWKSYLESTEIQFDLNLIVTEYVVPSIEKLMWHTEFDLPNDQICVDNTVMFLKSIRTPLIIDPEDCCLPFLKKFYSNKKVNIVKYQNPSFINLLESSIRFGNVLVITHVEYIDPILTPILNKELRRVGGRNLIKVGSIEVDMNKDFKLYMISKNESEKIGTSANAKVNVVNFTLTFSSLKTKYLHYLLQNEKPETEMKRLDLIKLQGEFKSKLYELEKCLLMSLVESDGDILENEKILGTLETLKIESSEIMEKSNNASCLVREIDADISHFNSVAVMCCKITFLIENLVQLNQLYKFDSSALMKTILYQSLCTNQGSEYDTSMSRLEHILKRIFMSTFYLVSRSLFQSDKALFIIILSLIYQEAKGHPANLASLEFLLRGNLNIVDDKRFASFLDDQTASRVIELSKTEYFKKLSDFLLKNPGWVEEYLSASNPEITESLPFCAVDGISFF